MLQVHLRPCARIGHHAFVVALGEGQRAVDEVSQSIEQLSVVSSDGSVSGFDTGPANCLLDAWIQKQRGEPFDQNGAWSAAGKVDSLLLLELMNDPYFKKPPPKSTGLEYFNLGWLEGRERMNSIEAHNMQATLAQLTASTVASAIAQYNPADVLVCGGGAHNQDLLGRLRILLPECTVESTIEHGLNPDCVEAVLFAWLARERIAGRPQDTGDITGASRAVLLGEVFKPGQGQ